MDDKNEIRIAISGKSGCGNTTVSGLLAKKLNITLINYTFRTYAAEHNITLQDVLKKAKIDNSIDKFVDTHQVELALAGPCVLGSRLAIWMLPSATLKVYLWADDKTRVARIHEREGGDISEIATFTKTRDAQDTARYKALYGIDNDDYKNVADIIIDTTCNTPDKIIDKIMAAIKH